MNLEERTARGAVRDVPDASEVSEEVAVAMWELWWRQERPSERTGREPAGV